MAISSVSVQNDGGSLSISPVVLSSHIARVKINQAGKVANSARGQLNRENDVYPVPVRG